MDRIRKEVSLTEEETPINIESPLNNTHIESKEEVKETKPKREKKKKKEIKKIERPKLITYTVTGCVKNSQGRFKFTDIIEAQDESIASDIYKQRAKKEFSAVRAVNKIEVKEFKEGDKKNTEEIVENLKQADPIKDNPLTDEELSRLILNTILTVNECKIYKVVYAPSKKKSVIRKAPKLYYMAKDLEEMKQSLEEEVKEQLGEYNEKWVQSVSILEDNLSEAVMETGIFKKVYRRVKKINQETKENLKHFYDKVEGLTSDTITDEDKEGIIKVLLEIPKIMLSSEDDESFIKSIGQLEIRKHEKSAQIETTDTGIKIRDMKPSKSALGEKYALTVEKDNNTNQLVLIKPVIPVVMNHNIFNTYFLHVERNGVEIIKRCKVIAETEDKASDYVVFVCKNENLIDKGNTLKIDVSKDNKLVAGFICKI